MGISSSRNRLRRLSRSGSLRIRSRARSGTTSSFGRSSREIRGSRTHRGQTTLSDEKIRKLKQKTSCKLLPFTNSCSVACIEFTHDWLL